MATTMDGRRDGLMAGSRDGGRVAPIAGSMPVR